MSETNQDREEQVRRRAYELWEQAGRPDGRHDDFWHQASAEGAGHGGTTLADAGSVDEDPKADLEEASSSPVGLQKPTLKRTA
jgi:Protein of unknown function (DUF2934)